MQIWSDSDVLSRAEASVKRILFYPFRKDFSLIQENSGKDCTDLRTYKVLPIKLLVWCNDSSNALFGFLLWYLLFLFCLIKSLCLAIAMAIYFTTKQGLNTHWFQIFENKEKNLFHPQSWYFCELRRHANELKWTLFRV